MEEIVVESYASPVSKPLSPRGKDWERQIQDWRQGMEHWRKESVPCAKEESCSPCRQQSPRWLAKEEGCSPCRQQSPRWLAKKESCSPRWLRDEKTHSPHFKAEEKEEFEWEEKVKSPRGSLKIKEELKLKEKLEEGHKHHHHKHRPEEEHKHHHKHHDKKWRKNCLRDKLGEIRKERFLHDRFWEGCQEKIPQACISKPYLNLAEALLLEKCTLERVEILTSPSAVFIDIDKVVDHFPSLQAGYNIFINVNECNAHLVRELDLVYALFVLDPLAPELTLTSLLPHLRPDGYYVFFYDNGMISVNGDTLIVKEVEVSENVLKLIRVPGEYPCKLGSWHQGVWKVYGVNLTKSQAKCLGGLASSGEIKLEHVSIKNESKMFYGDWFLRQFVEALVLSLKSVQLPVFVLSGIGSVPLIETIIYVYAQENKLVTDDSKIRVDFLLESWIGDEIPDRVVTCEQLRQVILRHRCTPGKYHKLMLQDPLLVRLIKEEQDLFAFGKVFAQGAPYTPELLE